MSDVKNPAPPAEEKKGGEIVKLNVINEAIGANENFKQFEYNGENCDTPEKKVAALRNHYRLSVMRKYGINPRNEAGEPIKNSLIVNDMVVRAKLPAIKVDENGAATEDLKQYYERTRNQAAGAYSTVMKGLERIDFVPEMM